MEPASYEAGGAGRFFVQHNSDPECAKDLGAEYNSIMWFKHFDEKVQLYKSD